MNVATGNLERRRPLTDGLSLVALLGMDGWMDLRSDRLLRDRLAPVSVFLCICVMNWMWLYNVLAVHLHGIRLNGIRLLI